MKRIKRVIIALYLLAVVSLYIMLFVVPDVMGALKQTSILEYGNITISDEVAGYVVRTETVYTADHSGEIVYYVGEGVKIRKDVRILDINAVALPRSEDDGDAEDESERAVYTRLLTNMSGSGVEQAYNAAPFGGVLSYFIDGYEKLFSPENIENLTYGIAESASGQIENVTRHENDYALKGEPIYKLVDNSIWYIVFWLDKESKSIVNYKTGAIVNIMMPGGDVRGTVKDVIDQNDYWMVTLSSNGYCENLAQLRRVDAVVSSSEYSGIIVENVSIITKDGQPGVYVRRRSGEYEFMPVSIKNSEGAESVVEASTFVSKDGEIVKTVNVYEEILRYPEQDKRGGD
jgi:putative membrane fusion protein